MPRAFSWLLAVRYLRARRVALLGVLGVAVAVWSLIVVIAVFSGFIAGIRGNVRLGTPDLLVTDLPARQSYQQLLPALQDAAVAAVAPRLRHYGTFFLRSGAHMQTHTRAVEFSHIDTNFALVVGVDPELEAKVSPLGDWIHKAPPHLRPTEPQRPFLVPPAEEARALARLSLPADPDRNLYPGLLLGAERAAHLHLRDVGEPIDLLTAGYDDRPGRSAEVKPLQMTFDFAGCFLTGHRAFDDTQTFVPIEPLRTLLGHDAADDGSVDLVTDIAIRLQPGADLAATAARLQQQVRALLPAAHPSVLTWEQQNQVFLDAVAFERAMMKIVLGVVVLIAAFLVYATVSMLVTQKVKDIGVLCALGGAPAPVGGTFVLCGLVLGLVGSTLGAGLGVVCTLRLNEILGALGIQLFPPSMFDLERVPVQLDIPWVVQVSCGALLIALLSAWLPARQASRLDPVQALAHE